MPLEFGLWRVDDTPVRVATRAMPQESRLEQFIEADPGHAVRQDRRPARDGRRRRPARPRTQAGPHAPRSGGAGPRLRLLGPGLTNEQIRDIYASYARGRGLPAELDEAFALRFGGSPPEVLNANHALTVVASEIDPATERIVTYLASGFQVPVNVLFFRYFEDEGRSYLARTWLIDETEAAAPPAGGKRRGKQEPWNGTDWYVSFGDDSDGRDWDDALRHGFVSAGGGDWFSRTLRSLPLGARVFTHIPKTGYVGVGTVSGEPQPFADALLDVDGETRRMADLPLKGTYRRAGDEADGTDEDRREWIVPVTWERAVPRARALWRPGFFANQNSACKLRARFTIEEVSRHFGLTEEG
ncbi:hypothetical protein ACFXA4_14620 [Streptomyces sp. NPDC059442]|uniref:hypothetical protein n=1 Tax=Streptomyces sp. NPDC059442 TaxID=3346830 RepID=UPI0036B29F43